MKQSVEFIGHIMNCENLVKTIIDGDIKGKRGRGRRRHTYMKHIIGDVSCNSYEEVKRKAQGRSIG